MLVHLPYIKEVFHEKRRYSLFTFIHIIFISDLNRAPEEWIKLTKKLGLRLINQKQKALA